MSRAALLESGAAPGSGGKAAIAWLTVDVGCGGLLQREKPPPAPSHAGRGTTAFAAMLARHVGLDPGAGGLDPLFGP